MACKFSDTGKFKVRLRVKDDDGVWSHDNPDPETWTNCYIYVFTMDLDIDGVPDSQEVEPGGFLPYNDDDDDPENDLRAIFLGYEPPELAETGTYMELEIPYSDNDIRVWTDSDKGTMVLPAGSDYDILWPVGSQPSPLWVEGYQLGQAELYLYFTPDGQTYPGGGPHNSDRVKFIVFTCDVTSADVCEDKIYVILWGQGATGTLKLELTGPGGSHTIREVTRSYGGYSETFDIPNLSVGEYTKVKATWTVDGFYYIDEYDYHIKVLGEYDHTCYNTPDESGCSGSLEWFSYVIANPVNPCGPAPPCNWINAQAKSEWLDEVEENGSGRDLNGYIYSLEHYCSGNDYSPKLRRTGAPCAQCGGTVSVGDVAVKPSHPHLGCGDTVCVHGHGTHTVVDTGSGVAEAQLDHYTGVSACNVCTPPGNDIMTIKLF